MFKTLALAAPALAAESLVADKLASFQIATNDGPDIKQTDSHGIFAFNPTASTANPWPVAKSSTEVFHVAGTWLSTSKFLDHVEFLCNWHIGGQDLNVYDENMACDDSTNCKTPTPYGLWTGDFSFDVPAIAPAYTYYITIKGRSADGEELFVLETNFDL